MPSFWASIWTGPRAACQTKRCMRTDAPAAIEPPALPRSFGRYVLFDHIGRGGMADIFLARLRTQLGGARNVVVKQILPALSDDPGFAAMLIEEAKLAAQLGHANVVQVFDLGREDGRLFIAMEYVEGFDLRQMLGQLTRARIPLPAEFALLVIREVLRGLDYAHRARGADGRPLGIVHRDVSPSNVLISFEGEVKLCDFGIARALGRGGAAGGPDETRVRRSRIAGKSAYMAPEQARGDALDARADIFAAGILLWELCAGRRLYKGTDEEMLAQARAGEVPPLPDRGLPGLERLQTIATRALAKDPDDRYPSAAEMLRDLEDYALAHRLMASPLRFGSFLADHFADAIVRLRREREKAADAIADGADPDTFGPSSAPPPAQGSGAGTITVPAPAALPREAAQEGRDPNEEETLVHEAPPTNPRSAPAEEPATPDDGAPTEPSASPAEAAPAAEPRAVPASPDRRRGLEPFSAPWLLLVGLAGLTVAVAFYLALR